jgi:RNA polymerase sigma-70 factor (ECF subfamily)
VEAALRLGRARSRGRVPYEMSLAERLLIGRLKDRDPSAFEEIFRRYSDKVFNLVYRMLGNRHEAEDDTQEVFITVFKTVDTFRGEAKFTTWLLRIAANQSKNRIKYLARRPTDVGDVEDTGGPAPGVGSTPGPLAHGRIDGPDTLLEAAEVESVLQKAINALDEEHRLLVILRDVEELSYQEIGEITGLPEGTIKSRLHRARMAIKEVLDKHTK